MTTDIPALQQRTNVQLQRYAANFAGHPRPTRNIDLLGEIITSMEELRAEADAAGEEGAQILETIDRSLETYQAEVGRIRSAREDGALALSASRAMTWSQFAISRYRRNFASRSRTDRDLGLLREILDDLAKVDADMSRLTEVRGNDSTLATAHDSARRNLDMYKNEVRAIRDTQNGQGSLADRATRYATLANNQFNLYMYHFAGKSRLSRRPELLDRMIANLEDIGGGMRALKVQGLKADSNERNIGIVDRNLGNWRTERATIAQSLLDAPFSERAAALGTAANERFSEYREKFAGQARDTRDLEALNAILEDLFHIARSMDTIDAADGDDGNARNFQVVLDRIRIYEREYAAIETAKQGGTS